MWPLTKYPVLVKEWMNPLRLNGFTSAKFRGQVGPLFCKYSGSLIGWSPDPFPAFPGARGMLQLTYGGIISSCSCLRSYTSLLHCINKEFLPIWNGAVYKIITRSLIKPLKHHLALRFQSFWRAFWTIVSLLLFALFYSEPFHRGTR